MVCTNRPIHAYAIRATDVAVSLLIVVLTFPLAVVAAAAIKISSRGPVFFRQDRLGHGGHIFRIFKFRTMVVGAERMGLGLLVTRDDDRITWVGRFLRAWSLDELPQLLNVVRGEMSLAGPRPALPSHISAYTNRQRRRLDVLPGITGWAQVNGRNRLSWPERIEKDIWYVEHLTFALYVRVLLRTIPVWLRREDIYGALEGFSLGAGHPGSGSAADPRPTGEGVASIPYAAVEEAR